MQMSRRAGRLPLVLLAALFATAQDTVSPGMNSEISRVLSILSQARDAALRIEDEGAKAYAFQSIARLQARAGDLGGAFATVELLRSGTEREDALMGIAVERAKLGDATSLETAANLQDEWNRAFVLRTLALAQAENGDWKGALHTSGTIPARALWEQTEALRGMAVLRSKAGDTAGARTMFEEAERMSDRAATASERVRILLAIASDEVRAGDKVLAEATFEQAYEDVADMTEASSKDGGLRMLCGYAASTGDFAKAFKLAQNIDNPILQSEAFEILALSQAQSGGLESAMQTAERTQDRSGQEFALGGIAIEQAKVGSLEDALSTVNRIKDDSRRAEYVASLGLMRSWRGDDAGARRMFALALQVASTLDTGQRKQEVLERIAYLQGQANDFAGARTIIEGMADDHNKAEGCWQIASAESRHGGVDAALSWAAGQSSDWCKAKGLLGVAEGILLRIGEKKADRLP